ncbi:Annexin [Coprinopsis marcescibilis]|uniref:Annexin n=1 Tax=Coprinopsis marcescibilis TaxID=230819 RepID=A0A5C3KLS3_COPMA|nr:Annexin [Coprinopsis marcescibilis]
MYGAPPVGAEVWYAGIKIVDPNASAAPLGSFKVPGYDPTRDFDKLKAFWGLLKEGRTEENKIISILLPLTVHERDALNDYALAKVGKDISGLIEPYTFSGEVRNIVRALVLGPLNYDVELANKSLSGIGTNEMLLTELILNRSQQDLRMLREAYKKRYSKDLVDAVKSDLSGKFERLFVMALNTQRTPDTVPVDMAQVTADVERLIKAGKNKEEIHFIEIFVNRSQPHLATVITQYGQKHKSLSKVIKKSFSGDMENALLYILNGVKPKRDGQGIWRDAKLLEKTMAGLGTRDSTLVYRVMRGHWDRARFSKVKAAYKSRYGKELEGRIRGETSGPYREAILAVVKLS